MSFSFKDRQTALDSLAENSPEVLIIGAGVVGCSIAAHAAKLGLNAVLVDKEDLASGASGNSTGLAHAGLRYLAQGRISYVFHEGRERQRLQELAPHWVQPFNFVLPVYKGDSYSFGMIRFGTWIYDILGWIDAMITKRPLVKRHQVLSADAVKAKISGIRSDGLLGGIEYYVDARLQDSRFTMGYAQQAAQHGARVITHCEATFIDTYTEQLPCVSLRDGLSGKTQYCSANLVINATGAWMDHLRQGMDMKNSLIKKSKGIHVIVDHITDSPLIMSASAKGQVFFVIPIDSKRTLVGTTDMPLEKSPDQAQPDKQEIAALLRQLEYYFPNLKGAAHVKDIYWGVRPLLAQAGSTLDASREHRLIKDLPRFWSFPGVKLTAGRIAGYEAATEAWRLLRQEAPIPAVTWDALPGGELWERFKEKASPDLLTAYLISLYGTRYEEVLQWAEQDPSLKALILPEEPWILAQAAYAVHEEMTMTLNDFLWRRVKWAHYRDLPEPSLREIAGVMGRYLSWNEVEIQKQIDEYRTELKKHRLP